MVNSKVVSGSGISLAVCTLLQKSFLHHIRNRFFINKREDAYSLSNTVVKHNNYYLRRYILEVVVSLCLDRAYFLFAVYAFDYLHTNSPSKMQLNTNNNTITI